MKAGTLSARLMVGLVFLVIAIPATGCSPVVHQAPTARASRLPVEGQLIILKGYRFTIPDGMVGTTWYFPSFDEAENIIQFSAGVASDRAAKYGGRPEDYLTVIWTGERLTEGDGSACPAKFYSQPGVGTAGTVIGSKNCIQMLEYRFTQ